MKKITALLLCFLLLCMCGVTAFATEPEDEVTNTVISASVPDCHKITVAADSARVFYEGISGEDITVGRLSEPQLLIRAESGKVIKSILLNGADVTDLLHGGYLDLDPICEDKVLTVITEDEPAAPEDTYTVNGKVTLNGQPLSDVILELRSVLKTTETDENGNFVFTDVEQGKHSLTAISDGKVIGYLSFELKKDNKTDVTLLEDGTYTVSVAEDGAGVELHLVLDEEKGTLAPNDIKAVRSEASQADDRINFWWWIILLLLSAVCIAVLEILRRKIKVN